MKKFVYLIVAFSSAHLMALGGTELYSKEIQTPVVETRIGMGFYGAIFGGANVHQDADIDDLEVRARGLDFDIETDLDSETGWFAGVKLGYVWDTHSLLLPALELEGFYNRVDVNIDSHSDVLATDARVSGELKSGVFMLNLLGKFDLGRFRPYIGAGAGAAYLEAGDIRGRVRIRGEEFIDVEADADDIDEVADVNSEGWTFAWQAIGGFDVYVTDNISIFAEYKELWFVADSDEISNYLQHLVGGGIRIHF